jgi:ubiquinone biosynthesis protein
MPAPDTSVSDRDRDLPVELRLVSEVPEPLPLESVYAIIEADFGTTAGELLHTLRSTPVAIDSAGQTHRSKLRDGTAVLVKIRRPDTDARLTAALAPKTVAARLKSWFQRASAVDALATELAAHVTRIHDYDLVAQRQDRFSWLFAGDANVVVPTIKRAWCSPRVLTSEQVSGATLTAFLAAQPAAEARDRAGAALFDFYLGTLFEHGLYAADPDVAHQIFLPGGRVACTDFASVREPATALIAQLAALTHALASGDRPLLAHAIETLGPPADESDFVASLLVDIYGPLLRNHVAAFTPWTGPTTTELLTRWRQTRQALPSAELLFLLRMVIGLRTMLGQLGARANWYQRLHERLRAYPQPTFDVVLVSPGDSAIPLARALLDATGLPLREIEYLMKKSPQTIKQALPRAEAEALRLRLEEAGAEVTLKQCAAPM